MTAILLYIAQSGNLLVGGGTLYLYALGMGLPLILVAVFGNRLLPKSGPWMESVKTAFGFVILALPVFLLERVVGDVWGLRMWSALGVAFFSLGVYYQPESQRLVGTRPADRAAGCGVYLRSPSTGLGLWCADCIRPSL